MSTAIVVQPGWLNHMMHPTQGPEKTPNSCPLSSLTHQATSITCHSLLTLGLSSTTSTGWRGHTSWGGHLDRYYTGREAVWHRAAVDGGHPHLITSLYTYEASRSVPIYSCSASTKASLCTKGLPLAPRTIASIFILATELTPSKSEPTHMTGTQLLQLLQLQQVTNRVTYVANSTVMIFFV